MKANEAPKKIYIHVRANKELGTTWHGKKITNSDIEYTRTDAFIEKAAEWHREDEQNLNACLGYIQDEFLRRWLKDVIHAKYDKTAWSEEDSEHLERILKELENQRQRPLNRPYLEEIESDYNWLNSLKDRVQPKQKVLEKLEEWLDEYVSDLADVDTASLICSFTNYSDGKLPKSIRPQPKQEWSEEDERLFQIIIDILDRENHLGNLSHTDLIACVRKLKSLRPRSQWKPSDEQIEALEHFVRSVGESGYAPLYDNNTKLIYSLLKQLKQL